MPLGTNGLGPVCISILTAGFSYPPHCAPSFTHLLHPGFLSSHFTRRVLHQSVCHLSPKFNNILACQTSRLHLWAPLASLLAIFCGLAGRVVPHTLVAVRRIVSNQFEPHADKVTQLAGVTQQESNLLNPSSCRAELSSKSTVQYME
jgi:hypothetical protein